MISMSFQICSSLERSISISLKIHCTQRRKYVRMLIAVASHAMDHESWANRRKNLEIYEKATSGEYAHTRPLACGRVCVRAVRARTGITLVDCAARASVQQEQGEKGPKIGSKFIRVPGRAATSLSPLSSEPRPSPSPSARFLSFILFPLLLLFRSRVFAFLFLSPSRFVSPFVLERRHPSSSFS